MTYLYKNVKPPNNKGVHMEITNTIFETLLKKNNFKKKEFSDYSKIPYDTVVGWKKKEYVPPYAIAILKDMNYRKNLMKKLKNY